MFTIGQAYTRDQIHGEVGGSVQSFLPTVKNEVVCACLSKKMNPNAPYEILVGNKPKVIESAIAFTKQDKPIPIFMKKAVNEWVYVGDFIVSKTTYRKEGFNRFNLGGREDIQIVLELDGGANILSSYSWQILSKHVAVKQSDKSVFLHHGTGIPKDVRSFFGVEQQREGEKVSVTLIHADTHYSADFVVSNDRTRLLWKSDFSNIIRAKFPLIYKDYTENDSTDLALPKLRFSSERDSKFTYFLQFLENGVVQQDIESEIAEEYEPKQEGTIKSYYGKRYERVPANRKKAIEIHGTKCKTCGFDFEKVYGERGKGFIEVHHTKPLSQLEETYVPDPCTDLIPVCSNCHRMIHRNSDNILSIHDLSEIIKKV